MIFFFDNVKMYFIIIFVTIILVIHFMYTYNIKLNKNINNWDMVYLDQFNVIDYTDNNGQYSIRSPNSYYNYLKSCAINPNNFLKDNANEIIKKLNIQFVSQLRINIADNYDEKAEVILDVSNIVAVNDLPFYNNYISNIYCGLSNIIHNNNSSLSNNIDRNCLSTVSHNSSLEFKITIIKRKKTRTAIYFILCEK